MSMPSSPRSARVITIANRDEMFGLLESARTDICLKFLSVLSVDICCVLVSFDAGLLWRGCPDVQASCKFRESKETCDATDVRSFCCLFLCLLNIRFVFSNDQLH